jgi:transposase-like protein
MKTIRGISDSDRLSIIQEYLNGSSKYSLVRKYNLGSSHSITAWMRIFGIEDTRTSKVFVMGKTNYSESDELQKLRKELKQIKLALYREKMRADSNETMIDVAEEMFNIPIRKKAGTK